MHLSQLFSWGYIRSRICVILLLFCISITRENCNFIKKEILTRVFSCDVSEIFKNTFFIEHFQTAASEAVTENTLGNSVGNEKLYVI